MEGTTHPDNHSRETDTTSQTPLNEQMHLLKILIVNLIMAEPTKEMKDHDREEKNPTV
jgi:hypothetical protein